MTTLEELRAIVGETGADLTDEQLVRLHQLAELIVRGYRDRLDPAGAARRRERDRLQLAREKAPRRRRYQREKAQALRAKRSA